MKLLISIGSADDRLIRIAHRVLQNDPSTERLFFNWVMDIIPGDGEALVYSVQTWVDNPDDMSRAYVELAMAIQVAQMKLKELVDGRNGQ